MMSEIEFQELASAYLAGRISDADASRLREHIANHPALLEELAGQHDLHIMLHSMSRSQTQRKNLADRVIAAVSPDLNRRKLESAVIRDIKISSASARKRRPSSRRVARRTASTFPRWIFPLAACVLMALTVFVFRNQPAPPETPDANIAEVTWVHSDAGRGAPVLISFSRQSRRETLRPGMKISPGDRIETPASSGAQGISTAQAAIKFVNGASLDLAEDTNVKAISTHALELLTGRLYGSSKALSSAAFSIKTNESDIELRNALFDLRNRDSKAVVMMEEGTATLSQGGRRESLSAMQKAVIQKQDDAFIIESITSAQLWKGRATRGGVIAGTHTMEVEEFGTARGATPADGNVMRPFTEILQGASENLSIAIPGDGMEITGDVLLNEGEWYLWVRYRDDDQGRPKFEASVNGKIILTTQAPGKDQMKWYWARSEPFKASGSTRLSLKSLFNAVLSRKGSNQTPYAVINRFDQLCLTTDPNYSPRGN